MSEVNSDNLFTTLLNATLYIGGYPILWREIVGNLFGLASAVGGMRRRVWAWPVGIVGNVLLFTVFFAVAFSTPQHTTLLGQAGRQVFFVITSVYGWWRWRANQRSGDPQAPAVSPRWATARERVAYLLGWAVGVVVVQWAMNHIGLGYPAAWWQYTCAAVWRFRGFMLLFRCILGT